VFLFDLIILCHIIDAGHLKVNKGRSSVMKEENKKRLVVTVEDSDDIQNLYRSFFEDCLDKKVIEISSKNHLNSFLDNFNKFDQVEFIVLDGYLSKDDLSENSLDFIQPLKNKTEAVLIAATSDPVMRKKMIEKGVDQQVRNKHELINEEKLNSLLN